MSDTLLLVGTGLVGGSFARAAKVRGVFHRVVGMDRDPAALAEAVRLGVVDAPAESFVGHAAVCIAVPVAGIAACVRDAVADSALHRGVPVFDVGSVKAPILKALRPVPPNYVPCHPIAGSERQGPAEARADLFEGRAVVLTPVATTDPDAVATVSGYWEGVGARVVTEDPAAHDRRFALVSHLPHLLAFAFMEVASEGPLDVVGNGFRDFVRTAGADPDVWTDILHANAHEVRGRLDELLDVLASYATMVGDDPARLRERLTQVVTNKQSFDALDR